MSTAFTTMDVTNAKICKPVL